MADIVNEHPKRPTRYPWTRWADGQPRKAIAGHDFVVEATDFVDAGRRWATRHDYMWLSEIVDGGHVLFTLTKVTQ